MNIPISVRRSSKPESMPADGSPNCSIRESTSSPLTTTPIPEMYCSMALDSPLRKLDTKPINSSVPYKIVPPIFSDASTNVDSLIEQFGDVSSGTNSGIDEHLTDLGIFTAANPPTQDYQIVVMYYKVDDSECLAEWFDSASEGYITGMPEQFSENEDFQMDMNWYTDEDGDAYALLSSFVLTDDSVADTGYPDHSGAFIGFYVSGDNGMYISVTDFSSDATGIDMLDEFCDVMGIISPVAERE